MLTPERPPTPYYLELFTALTNRYAQRLAREIMVLAAHLTVARPRPITLVSLARAGTPIGALLARALRHLGRSEVRHYSISLIRDRGIDANALRFLLRQEHRDPAGLAFIDGWTAKGGMTEELQRAVRQWNDREPEQLDAALHVVADLSGTADVAATHEDYAIPSGILNATVSGLISRSIWNAMIGPEDFHGCVFYQDFIPYDRSQWFLDRISEHFPSTSTIKPATLDQNHGKQQAWQYARQTFLTSLQVRYALRDRNLIKPGIAEATRVLLRRVPGLLLLKNPDHPDVAHLRWLAAEKQVPLRIDPTLPFQAVALIQDLS